VNSGIQSITISQSGTYNITIAGAQGGNCCGAVGGLGAAISGELELAQGDVVSVLVGQKGSSGNNYGSGGGGGTFLQVNDELMLAAGGGSGGSESGDGNPGLTEECGGNGDNGFPGGCNGDGGTDEDESNGAPGGGGYSGNGQCVSCYSGSSGTGKAFLNGGYGGHYERDGGFGGGAAGWDNGSGGAAGGGYSGGGSQLHGNGNGGGGGSFVNDMLSNVSSNSGANGGDGYVTITSMLSPTPTCNLGCTYPQACNYNPESNFDDGSCDYCFCGEGTQWVDSLQACMVTEAALMQACGEGTHWDDVEQACLTIETCEEDLDGDGIVGINDLLELLSSFGSECVIEPETAEWTCGDPMNYHGYDYATVQIGEQCWFAENLRTELYQNGDSIPLLESGWTQLSSPAFTSFNNDSELSDVYGYLYNWFAIAGSNICPVDWRVSTQQDFTILHQELGGEEIAGGRMKEEGFDFWQEPNEGATNSSGLTALPGGWLNGGSDEFFDLGLRAGWWTSSEYSVALGVGHWLLYNQENASFPGVDKKDGYSVRCIKD
jgi:uncharacterized protein (TIGR02145 family)